MLLYNRFNQNSNGKISLHVEFFVGLLVENNQKTYNYEKTQNALQHSKNCAGSAQISNQNVHTKKR